MIKDAQIPLLNFDFASLKRDALQYKDQYSELTDWDFGSVNDPLSIAYDHYLLSLEHLARWANAISQDYSLISSRTYDAVVAWAASLGYIATPSDNSKGKCNLLFTGQVTADINPYDIVVSITANDGEKAYYTNSDPIYLTSSVTSVSSVDFVEGRRLTINKTSNGLPNQAVVFQGLILATSIAVMINGELWTAALSLNVATATDKVYLLRQVTSTTFLMIFGDNVHGMIPPLNVDIDVTYTAGGGVRGNISSTNLSFTIESTTASYGLTTVTNGSNLFTGGTDAESSDHIKLYAPMTVKSQDRLVSTIDIRAYAESYSGVARAKVLGGQSSNALVYIVPNGGETPSQTLITNLQSAINSKMIVGHEAIVSAPQYVTVSFAVNVVVYKNYTSSQVASDIQTALLSMLNPLSENAEGDYINDFGSSLTVSAILNKIKENKAVVSASVIPTPSDGIVKNVASQQIITDIGSTIAVFIAVSSDAELTANTEGNVVKNKYVLSDPRNLLL